MRTVVVHPPRWGRDRTVQVVAHRITQDEADQLCQGLRLPVTADVDYSGRVHLRARKPVTVPQEVTVLAAFIARTDCPLRWHPAVER